MTHAKSTLRENYFSWKINAVEKWRAKVIKLKLNGLQLKWVGIDWVEVDCVGFSLGENR